MSRATRDTEAREQGGNPNRVSVLDPAAHGPSPKQLHELLHILIGTPAGIVQQVGYLLMLFVDVVKVGAAANNDSSAASGGNCGDSTANCRTPDQVATGAAGQTRGSTTVTAAERKSAISLLQAATKEAKKKNKMRGAAKASIKSGRCLEKTTDGSDAAKAKTLQCWAAKGKQNVRQLVKILLGLLVRWGIGLRVGSSAAGAAFELMIGVIDAALHDDGKTSNGSVSPSSTPSPSSSQADIAVGGEDIPTSAVDRTSTSKQQQLKHFSHDERSDLVPVSLPGGRIVETPSPSSWSQERRSSNGAQPSNVAGIGIVGHANNTAPAFVLSTSPLSSSLLRKLVRGTAAAGAAASLSEETPSSSPKEDMFTIFEAADERWPSSDDDGEEAPLTRKMQASLVLDEVTNTPGPAGMAAEGGTSTTHSPPPAGVALDQEVVMPSGVALNLDAEASTRSEPPSGAGEPYGGGQIVPYGYMPTGAWNNETAAFIPLATSRHLVNGRRLHDKAVNIIPSQMDVDPSMRLSIGAPHRLASFGPLEARSRQQQQPLQESILGTPQDVGASAVGRQRTDRPWVTPSHHEFQDSDDTDDSSVAADSEGENEHDGRGDSDAGNEDEDDDEPPPPPSAGRIDRDPLDDLLRAFAGLAALRGSSDGVESDGDERSSGAWAASPAEMSSAALATTTTERDLNCDARMGVFLCLEEREYPRCRAGYENLEEGQAKWALSVIGKIADAIDAPTHTVTLAAITLGVAGGVPGLMDALSNEQIYLLPAACVADSICRLQESGTEESPAYDLNRATDAMLTITKTSSEGRGDGGARELFNQTDKRVRTAVLEDLLRTLSPSDIARGAFFDATGVSVNFTVQSA
ncbi:unnamed protein product [Ectocarpus sp. CCAP 1310/34]|nr:unnamed protein product [Ectocarpus sp. CCAP 1310/34]